MRKAELQHMGGGTVPGPGVLPEARADTEPEQLAEDTTDLHQAKLPAPARPGPGPGKLLPSPLPRWPPRKTGIFPWTSGEKRVNGK